MFSKNEITILKKLWANVRITIPIDLDQVTRDKLPRQTDIDFCFTENQHKLWVQFDYNLNSFILNFQNAQTIQPDFWFCLTNLHYPIRARIEGVNYIPILENHGPIISSNEIADLQSAAKIYLQTIKSLEVELIYANIEITHLKQRLADHENFLTRLAADKANLVGILKQREQRAGNTLIGATATGVILTIMELLKSKAVANVVAEKFDSARSAAAHFTKQYGAFTNKLNLPKLTAGARQELEALTTKEEIDKIQRIDPIKSMEIQDDPQVNNVDYTKHRLDKLADTRSYDSEMRDYQNQRLNYFRSSARPQNFTSGLSTDDIPENEPNRHSVSVPFCLEVFTRILLLSNNICSHKELNSELKRLTVPISPQTLSSRITNWTKVLKYVLKIEGPRSAYMIDPSALDGTYGLRAAVPDISNEMWDEFIASVPPALLKK